jgi:hypothetical protein
MNDQSDMPLDMLQLSAEHNFEGITTGDESWFLYTTYEDSMFAISAREVVPRTKQNIYAKKTMAMVCFPSTRLLVLNFLPKGTNFNQDYFIDTALPNLYNERDELRGARAYRVFQSTWTIQCVITAQRSLKNLRSGTSREFLTHSIHQISARVTFGYLGS